MCKHCSAEIKYSGGNTTNLSSNSSSYHLSEIKPAGSALQPTISVALSSSKMYPRTSSTYLMLQKKVATHLVADLKPFATVESESFKDLCASLNPRFAMPLRKVMSSNVIPKMILDQRGKVQAILDTCHALALTTDGWTSAACESYVTITSHFIDDELKMRSIGLQTRHTPQGHTAENLRDLFLQAFNEWKLSDKEIVGVMDNARNITKAWMLLNRKYVNCFAHTLKLAVRKGIALESDTVKRAKKLVSFIHHSTSQTTALKQKQRLPGMPERKLKIEVETRWNSTYDMIVSITDIVEPISAVLQSQKKTEF